MNTLGRAHLRTMISPENQHILGIQDNDDANAHIDWMADIMPTPHHATQPILQPLAPFHDEVDFGFGGIRTDDEDEAAEFWE